MISDTIELRGFDERRAANLWSLFLPASGSGGPAWPGGAIVLTRKGRTIKVIHTPSVSRRPLADGEGTLAEIAARLSVSWVIRVDVDAAASALGRAQGKVRPGDSLFDLGYGLFDAVTRTGSAGGLELWPPLFDGLPTPSRRALERVYDVLLPANTAVLVYVFDQRGALFCEGIGARGERDLELVAGHDALGLGSPSPDWRKSYRSILEGATRRVAPPSAAAFMTVEAAKVILYEGLLSPKVPALIARKDLIFDPMPVWLAAPLGAVAIKDVAERGRQRGASLVKAVDRTGLGTKLAGRVGGALLGRIKENSVVGRARQGIRAVSDKVDLAEVLGFDPFTLLARLSELNPR